MSRLAIACTEPGCMWRDFGNPEARCPNHPNKSCVQKNRPYMGKAVETPKVGRLPIVDAGKALRRR